MIKTMVLLILSILISIPVIAQENLVYDYSGEEKNIVSKKVETGTILYKPNKILIIDKHLIITDASNEPSITVFELENPGSLLKVKALGRQGRGPGEFLNPWGIVESDGEAYFYVYDAGLKRMIPYTRDFELADQETVLFKSSSIYTKIQEKNGEFIASGLIIDCFLEVMNDKGEKIDCVGDKPTYNFSSDVNQLSLASRWHSYGTWNEAGDKVALVYRYATRTDIFSKDGKLLDTIEDPKTGTPKIEIINGHATGGSNDLRAYISVTSDDEYIYALYSGKVFKDASSSLGTQIHKFDWSLNLLDIYELDHKSIHIESNDNGGIYSLEYAPSPSLRFFTLE